jgi:hypothetical protein
MQLKLPGPVYQRALNLGWYRAGRHLVRTEQYNITIYIVLLGPAHPAGAERGTSRSIIFIKNYPVSILFWWPQDRMERRFQAVEKN